MLRLLIEGIDGGRVKRLSAGHADHYMSSSRMSALKLILLQKSKIVRPGESRESRFLDAPAVARLSGANTKVGGRALIRQLA
jgi:hypothetical protein